MLICMLQSLQFHNLLLQFSDEYHIFIEQFPMNMMMINCYFNDLRIAQKLTFIMISFINIITY